MSDIEIVDLSVLDMDLPQDFSPVSEGLHNAFVNSAKLTMSKAGKPMVHIQWTVADTKPDGEPDSDAGKVLDQRIVVYYFNKRTNKNTMHWFLPPLFQAADMWPGNVTKRAEQFKKENLNGTFDKMLAYLNGCSGTIEVQHTKGAAQTDEMGNPKVDAEGNQLFFTNTEVVIQKIDSKKSGKRKIV